jgi:hypothetical protein
MNVRSVLGVFVVHVWCYVSTPSMIGVKLWVIFREGRPVIFDVAEAFLEKRLKAFEFPVHS